MRMLLLPLLWVSLFAHAGETALPTDIPGLLSFWDFQEPAGQKRVAKGKFPYALVEAEKAVERVEGGYFGTYAAKIEKGHWLHIPRGEFPGLDIKGKDAAVTVVAWIKRSSTTKWQAIGGVWDESRSKRQYYLFLNAASRTDKKDLTRKPCGDLIHGHISSVGSPTPDQKFCVTYASGNTPVALNEWHCIAMSYDGKQICVYLDGELDRSETSNPFPYDEGIFDGGADGADFTVGSNSVGGKPSNFFGGLIGGLAVYGRVLTTEEMKKLGSPRK